MNKKRVLVISTLVLMSITAFSLTYINNKREVNANNVTGQVIAEAASNPKENPKEDKVVKSTKKVEEVKVVNNIPVAPEEVTEVKNATVLNFVEPVLEKPQVITTSTEDTKENIVVEPTKTPVKRDDKKDSSKAETKIQPTKAPVSTKTETVKKTDTSKKAEKVENKVEPTKAPTVKKETTKNTKPTSSKTYNINSVKVPQLDSYLSIIDDGNFNIDNEAKGELDFFKATKEVSKKIKSIMEEVDGEKITTEGWTTVFYDYNKISICPTSSMQEVSMYLEKNINENQYELTLRVSLTEDRTKYWELNQTSLKLLLSSFSSTPEKLFNLVLDAYALDNKYNVSKDYKTFKGIDCQVKYDVVDSNIVIYFKEK